MSSNTKSAYNHLVIERMNQDELGKWLESRKVPANVIEIMSIFDGTMFLNLSDTSIEKLLKKAKGDQERNIIILQTLRDSVLSTKSSGDAAAAAVTSSSPTGRAKNFKNALQKNNLPRAASVKQEDEDVPVIKKDPPSTAPVILLVAFSVHEAFVGHKVPKTEKPEELCTKSRRAKGKDNDPADKGAAFNHLLDVTHMAVEVEVDQLKPLYDQVSNQLINLYQ
jgi:hypothetical protein